MSFLRSIRALAPPIDPSDVFLFHKTTNRRTYDRARRAGYDEVILWNPRREVTEATMANIVVEIDGRRVTPPLECGCRWRSPTYGKRRNWSRTILTCGRGWV